MYNYIVYNYVIFLIRVLESNRWHCLSTEITRNLTHVQLYLTYEQSNCNYVSFVQSERWFKVYQLCRQGEDIGVRPPIDFKKFPNIFNNELKRRLRGRFLYGVGWGVFLNEWWIYFNHFLKSFLSQVVFVRSARSQPHLIAVFIIITVSNIFP